MGKKEMYLNKAKQYREKVHLKPFPSIKVASKPRQIFIILLSFLLVASIAGLVWSYDAFAEQEVENTKYYYLHKALLDYRVHLTPNDLFDERILEPGRAYITSLTDLVVVNFDYYFMGEKDAELSGEYNVQASLLAYTSQEEHLVWEKHFDIVSGESFNEIDSDLSISEKFSVPLAKYVQFADEAREKTGYNPAELNLVINCDVVIEAVAEEGIITETLSPNMIIPLRGNTFTVGGELIAEKEGGITDISTVAGVQDNNPTGALAAMVGITALAIVLIRVFTVPHQETNKHKQQEVSKIVKKHKERIVITANGVTAVPEGAITVYSFDELIKLADEINKPILYPQPKSDITNEHIFLIYTSEQIFAYQLVE